MLAGVIAVAGSLMLRRAPRGGRALAAAAFTIAVAAIVIGAIWVYMPLRGNQKASDIAVTVRAGMAGTALGMIRAHPQFGIGVGEFTNRAGEFAGPGVLAIFPAARENAHNDFLQIGAELGIPGLLLFVALLAGAANAARSTAGDTLRAGLIGALVAFLLTSIGGHPLLTREVSYTFWLLLGCVAASRMSAAWPRPLTAATGAAIVLIAATTPLRTNTLLADANLDHVGVGVSQWQTSTDGMRYREADEGASVFVPATVAFGVGVQAVLDRPVRLKATLDGRTIDIVVLAPGRWTDLSVPLRDRVPRARYSRLDLRLIDAPPHTKLWITKDRAFQ
jgi:hypothetical protein